MKNHGTAAEGESLTIRQILHCHTVFSDGKMTPEEVKKHYQEKGYQVLAITDHDHYGDHRQLCDENFVAIAALETDMNQAGDMLWKLPPYLAHELV